MPIDTSQSQFEKTFSDLANARLRDKSPVLLEYLVGFQIIDCDDDGSRGVGMFAFQIGGDWHYSAVFFLNAEIKGLDSIYSVKSDLFVPLNEDWVNSIINRRPAVLGSPDKRNRIQRGVRTPDYNRLRQLPAGISDGATGLGLGKNAAERAADRRSAGDPPPIADVVRKFESMRKLSYSMDLPQGLAAMGPQIRDAFKAALNDTSCAEHIKLANATREFYPNIDWDLAGDFTVKAAAEDKKKDAVTIISSIDQDGVDELSDDARKQIIEGDVAVVDRRPEMEKSLVYSTESKQDLTNPTAGGLYDVLYSDGRVLPTLVVPIEHDNGKVFVLRLEDDKTCRTVPAAIYTVRQYTETDFRKELEKVSVGADKLRPGDRAIFVATDGETTTGPVEIKTKTTEGDLTTYRMHPGSTWGLTSVPEFMKHRDRGANYYPRPLGYIGQDDCSQIVVAPSGNRRARKTRTTLFVNSKYYDAVVYDHVSASNELSSADNADKFLEACDFGDHNTITLAMKKSASEIKVWRDDHAIIVRDDFGTHEFGKVAALSHLLKKHGCAEADARSVIRLAERQPRLWYIKHAASKDLLAFPDIHDSADGGEMSSFHTSQVPYDTAARATSPDNRMFYQYFSPFGHGDSESDGSTTGDTQEGDPFKAIDHAVKTGQREVFDASVLGSLAKTHAPMDMIERFLPTIVAGMDRLGRILFLLHWHYDAFQERYGKSDLLEFSDDLRSSFEGLGDLVIFMRKKTLSGDPEFYGLGINASMEG